MLGATTSFHSGSEVRVKRAVLICPEPVLREEVEQGVENYPGIAISKSVEYYPQADALRRLLRGLAPEVVFLSLEDLTAAETVSRQLSGEFPLVQQIAVSATEEPATLRFALEMRMANLVIPPFEDQFITTLERVSRHLEAHPSSAAKPGALYAFVPAKGGVGASTLAANISWALADVPDNSVLLADLDLHSGVTGFIFNVEHDYSIADAVMRGKELDDETWRRLVRKVGKVDLLLSGIPEMEGKVAGRHITPILDFARDSYTSVCADLSDVFDERSTTVMREATQIFLVTTPDLVALRLARQKATAINNLGFGDKIHLVLNRSTRKMELSVTEIEEVVGVPVFATFPCDYADVTRALRNARPSPKLASSAQQFIQKLLDRKPPEKRTRFTEYFAVIPSRYRFG